jgi:hypothetical protein
VLMLERTSPLSVTARLSIVVSTVGCGVTPTWAAGQARAFDQRRPAASSGVHPDHLVGDHGHPVRDATLVFEAPHPQLPAGGIGHDRHLPESDRPSRLLEEGPYRFDFVRPEGFRCGPRPPRRSTGSSRRRCLRG